jgi:hypothetical protein
LPGKEHWAVFTVDPEMELLAIPLDIGPGPKTRLAGQ